MKRRTVLQAIPAAALLPDLHLTGAAESSDAVYELRIYHAAAGRLDDLVRRFREHTLALFERHGMKTVAFWLPTDEPQKGAMLVYILRHASRQAAEANWKSFRDDVEWNRVKTESEAKGPLVDKVDSTYLALTDFSPQLP
jgi:hypothetical protein